MPPPPMPTTSREIGLTLLILWAIHVIRLFFLMKRTALNALIITVALHHNQLFAL